MTKYSLLASFAVAIGCATLATSQVFFTPEGHPAAFRATSDLVEDWPRVEALPSIETPMCRRYIDRVQIVRIQDEREWIDRTTLCPYMSDGCTSSVGACPVHRKCAAGATVFFGSTPRIFLSPGEAPEGDYSTVRHEMIHVVAACTPLGIQQGHSDPRLWGTLFNLRPAE